MTRVALGLHLLAVVLAIGPVTVAASLFPAVLRREGPASALTAFLHRTCRVYALVGLAAPTSPFAAALANAASALTGHRLRQLPLRLLG